MNDPRIKKIRKLEERIRELESTAENKRRSDIWSDHRGSTDYIWHPLPKTKEKMPYSFEIERIGYAQMLGFSLVKFYTDPIEFLMRQLEMNVFKFETFSEDCTPIAKSITYWPGVGFEMSLMGQPQLYSEEDAWIGREPVINERVPLSEIEYPDFYENPVMKEADVFYHKMREILSDDFTLLYPQWCRSPWSIAYAIRGYENLVYDYYEDPEWLLGFVNLMAEYRIRWSKQRGEYLGAPLTPTNFYNDELMAPAVSKEMYREMILPSEKRVSEAFGGINYWHSCGDTVPFLEDINSIPNVTMVQVSPWTDVLEATKVYDKTKVLEIAIHPLTEVLTPEYPEKIDEKLIEIKEMTKDFKSVCRSDGFMVMDGDVAGTIKKLQHWIERANRIFLD